jgi:hypothetical protein
MTMAHPVTDAPPVDLEEFGGAGSQVANPPRWECCVCSHNPNLAAATEVPQPKSKVRARDFISPNAAVNTERTLGAVRDGAQDWKELEATHQIRPA